MAEQCRFNYHLAQSDLSRRDLRQERHNSLQQGFGLDFCVRSISFVSYAKGRVAGAYKGLTRLVYLTIFGDQ